MILVGIEVPSGHRWPVLDRDPPLVVAVLNSQLSGWPSWAEVTPVAADLPDGHHDHGDDGNGRGLPEGVFDRLVGGQVLATRTLESGW
jgi:hypothetical protein